MSIENLDSEYPTDEQIEACFRAWKTGGEHGILEYLKQQRLNREAQRPDEPIEEPRKVE
jgi:hypothetical protein